MKIYTNECYFIVNFVLVITIVRFIIKLTCLHETEYSLLGSICTRNIFTILKIYYIYLTFFCFPNILRKKNSEGNFFYLKILTPMNFWTNDN